MRRRKKKKMISGKSIVYIVTIAMLNFMGISYGVWNDNLNVDLSTSTGNIDPEFYIEGSRIIGNDKGQLTLSLSNGNRTLNIDGWCYPTFNEKIVVRIKNNGSIPVVLDDMDRIIDDDIIKKIGSSSVKRKEKHDKEYFIDANDDEKFDIHIQAEKEDVDFVEEDHGFMYELGFEQGLK